jgi:hypothetical protein
MDILSRTFELCGASFASAPVRCCAFLHPYPHKWTWIRVNDFLITVMLDDAEKINFENKMMLDVAKCSLS